MQSMRTVQYLKRQHIVRHGYLHNEKRAEKGVREGAVSSSCERRMGTWTNHGWPGREVWLSRMALMASPASRSDKTFSSPLGRSSTGKGTSSLSRWRWPLVCRQPPLSSQRSKKV